MDHDTKQQWLDLCCEVAYCDDPSRIEELKQAIIDMLNQEKQRLEAQRKSFRVAR